MYVPDVYDDHRSERVVRVSRERAASNSLRDMRIENVAQLSRRLRKNGAKPGETFVFFFFCFHRDACYFPCLFDRDDCSDRRIRKLEITRLGLVWSVLRGARV